MPLVFTSNDDVLTPIIRNYCICCSGKLDWFTLYKEDLLTYYLATDTNLSNINLCKDANYKSVEDKLYDKVAALVESGKLHYKCKNKFNIKPGWNELVEIYHADSRDAI